MSKHDSLPEAYGIEGVENFARGLVSTQESFAKAQQQQMQQGQPQQQQMRPLNQKEIAAQSGFTQTPKESAVDIQCERSSKPPPSQQLG